MRKKLCHPVFFVAAIFAACAMICGPIRIFAENPPAEAIIPQEWTELRNARYLAEIHLEMIGQPQEGRGVWAIGTSTADFSSDLPDLHCGDITPDTGERLKTGESLSIKCVRLQIREVLAGRMDRRELVYEHGNNGSFESFEPWASDTLRMAFHWAGGSCFFHFSPTESKSKDRVKVDKVYFIPDSWANDAIEAVIIVVANADVLSPKDRRFNIRKLEHLGGHPNPMIAVAAFRTLLESKGLKTEAAFNTFIRQSRGTLRATLIYMLIWQADSRDYEVLHNELARLARDALNIEELWPIALGIRACCNYSVGSRVQYLKQKKFDQAELAALPLADRLALDLQEEIRSASQRLEPKQLNAILQSFLCPAK